MYCTVAEKSDAISRSNPDEELVDVRLLDVRIDTEVRGRIPPIDLVEVVRPKHFGGDVRMLVAQVHELELTTEQAIAVTTVVRAQHVAMIAEQVESRADARRRARGC